MSVNDIHQIKAIELECHLSPWSLLDYKSEIHRTDSLSFTAKNKSEVVGFLLARLITTKENITNTKIGDKSLKEDVEAEIEIYNIAITPLFQRQGIGAELFEKLISKTDHYRSRSIWLEVRGSNVKAVRFYQKHNFNQITIRRNFYSNPTEDGIIMNKVLHSF